MSGKPKPPHLKVLEGNRGKRGIDREVREEVAQAIAAGKPTARTGSPPVWMSAGAKTTWRRILKERGLVWLDTLDRELLASFCTAYARLIEAEKKIAKHGMTYETVNGGVGMRPEVRIVNQCSALVRSLGSELGMSPAARARLGTKPREKEKAEDLPSELKRGPKNSTGA